MSSWNLALQQTALRVLVESLEPISLQARQFEARLQASLHGDLIEDIVDELRKREASLSTEIRIAALKELEAPSESQTIATTPQVSFQKEEWRAVNKYPGYQVSNWGNVLDPKGKNCRHQHEGKQFAKIEDHDRHFLVEVAQLVAETFIPNPKNYFHVNHYDKNPSNNRVDNLTWGMFPEKAPPAQATPSTNVASQSSEYPGAVEMYQSGYGLAKLANHFSVNWQIIRDYLISQGVKIRKPGGCYLLNAEQKAKALSMMKEGVSVGEIAKALNKTIRSVEHSLNGSKKPATKNKGRRLTNSQKAHIINLKAEGFNSSQIANRMGISVSTVTRILRAQPPNIIAVKKSKDENWKVVDEKQFVQNGRRG